MGVIQGSINQLLTMGTALAAGAKHFQGQNIAKQETLTKELGKATVLEAKENAALTEGTQFEEAGKAILGQAEKMQEMSDIGMNILEAKTPDTLIGGAKRLKQLKSLEQETAGLYTDTKKLAEAAKPVKEAQERLASLQEQQKALEAQERAVSKGQQQVKQKRKFREYVERIELSVSQFSPKAQKAILQQYPKDRRKQIMDTMDKERMKKNG